MGVKGKSAVVYVSARVAPATPRRDALSPRCAHPRLFLSHVPDAPTTAPPASVPRRPAPAFLPHVGHTRSLPGDAPRRHGHPIVLCDNSLAQGSISTVFRERVDLYSRAQRFLFQRWRRQREPGQENNG